MPIHLYTEHLLNIRTLSVQASLPTPSSHATLASISADGSLLIVTHEEEVASIRLPVSLPPDRASTISLDIPALPQKELRFRVPLEAKDSAINSHEGESGIIAPWTADQLTVATEICCKSCRTVVVPRGKIQQWKDLPSEGWAEMMDFWHCHKPEHPDGPHAHGTDGRDFHGAGNKLALESGVGMVDALNFLVTAQDCEDLKVGYPYSITVH